MTIKVRLLFLSLIFVILISFIGIIAAYSGSLVENKTKLRTVLGNVLVNTAQLNNITNEFIMFHEERMLQQWKLKYVSLGKLLKRLTAEKGWSEKDRESFKLLVLGHQALADLPSRLSQTWLKKERAIEEKAPAQEIQLLQNLEELEVSRVVVLSHEIATEAFKIFNKKELEMNQFRRNVNLNLILIIIAFSIFAFIISLRAYMSIFTPLNDIIKYTAIFAQGELDSKIPISTAGIIGKLGKSINKMAQDLRVSQDAISQYNRKLEIRVAERTKELNVTYDKMARVEKLAVMGKMAGMVSHELRNPLGVIRNSIYFLRMRLGESLKDEKVARHFNILEEEIAISDRIVSDILAFGRINAPELKKIDLSLLLRDSQKRIIIPETIQISLETIDQLPAILADAEQLIKVFSNLILNAVQAMPQGGRITICGVAKDTFIEISVMDTGAGIAQENLSEIFEPFFTTKAKGAGLGLALCKTIVENHKGRIVAESELGKGTTFIVRLPIAGA